MAMTSQPAITENASCSQTKTVRETATIAPRLYPRATAYFDAIDKTLIGLVVVFAFLSASFPARNSDFLLHAASGRLLAQGQYQFGVDPFSFATEGAYWCNHSWLCDLFFYELYSVPEVGGIVVVLLKAILIAALAFMLLQTAHRKGASFWLPSALVAWAVLVLSPRLLLQSVCVSYLFLGLTLWLLYRPLNAADAPVGRWNCYWLLPPLFALWVNLDEWFLLGPAAVALFLLGEGLHIWSCRLAEEKSPSRGQLRTLGLVLAVGVGACLLNPHHVHAFALPWELGLTQAGEALAQDADFHYLFGSSFQNVLLPSASGFSLAAWAYPPLVILGLISFALTWGRWRWQRVLIWLAFFALSCITYRAAPFFAIVSASLVSLNFLDFLARRFDGIPPLDPKRLRWMLGVRVGALAFCGLLTIAVARDWLHSPAAHRRMGWEVRLDPSLRQAALRIRDWREQGLIPADARFFDTLPDAACYRAWFCPGQRSFVDLRLSLFAAAMKDFVAVRNALVAKGTRANDALSSGPSKAAWRSAFRKWDINYLLFFTRDPRASGSQIVEQRLLLNPDEWAEEWSLCYLDGRTMIATWKDREREAVQAPYARLSLNFGRLAFGSQATETVDLPSDGSLAADEAFVHWLRYQILGPSQLDRNRRAWEASMAASLSGCAAAPGGPLANGTLWMARLDFTYRVLHGQAIAPRGTPPQSLDLFAEHLLSNHLAAQESGPTESLFLALRAARRALRQNPDDTATQLLLGEVYLRLAWKTRERDYARLLPHVALIRQAQAAAALERAARLNPNLERAHALLVELYENAVEMPIPQPGKPWSDQLVPRPHLESVLKHRREQARCLREAGPRSGESAETFAQRLEPFDRENQQLGDKLAKRLDRWELNAADESLLPRVRAAREEGLDEKALNLLIQENAWESVSGPARALAGQWAVEGLLLAGRLQEAREILLPENQHALGMLPAPLRLPAYAWYRLQLAAAEGDSTEAEEILHSLLSTPRMNGVTASSLLAQTIGHQLLWEAPLATAMPWQVLHTSPMLVGLPPTRTAALMRGLEQSLLLLQQETDVLALRGWLALESGDVAAARRCLDQVLDRSRDPAQERMLTQRAGPLALLYRQWLQANE